MAELEDSPAPSRITIWQGDITTLAVDAIVNAANSALAGGGGVDGAIHKAAGSELYTACAALGGCPTGEAVITPGFNLPARYIIHTVGPIWRGGKENEPELLRSCYRESFRVAVQNQCKSIAFSAISTGVYGFPKQQACSIAIEEAVQQSKILTEKMEIVFVCFDALTFNLYLNTLQQKGITLGE